MKVEEESTQCQQFVVTGEVKMDGSFIFLASTMKQVHKTNLTVYQLECSGQ